jgi:hypothetical protein
MDDQTSQSRTGALRPERARATPFACPDVGPGVIAMTLTAVVQGLTSRADIAIVFQFAFYDRPPMTIASANTGFPSVFTAKAASWMVGCGIVVNSFGTE